MNIYKEMGLREVINANGKMTILGVSTASRAVVEQMGSALGNFVVIEELMDYTGKVIARKTGAEAGCPTCGAASGVVIAVAACIAGTNLSRVEQIPCTQGMPNEIIVQKGQVVNFGGNMAQMIRIGGGVPTEVGCANKVEKEHITGAITDKTAALLYVKSHHAVQKGMQSLETMLEIAREYHLPLIMDAASEEDLKKYVALGIDLVVYSGGKALCGPTSGLIAGKKEAIVACRKQYKGIGRAMKVSKEAMVGLITALEQYQPENSDRERQKENMGRVCEALNQLKGLRCRVEPDEAGRDICRAAIEVDADVAGISAVELNERLKNGNPAIYLREYYAAQGVLSIDPRPLFPGQEDIIVEQVKRCLLEVQ